MSVLAQTILAVAQQQAESASALQAEVADLRRQLEEAQQDAERWKQKAERAEARRQHDSADAYNARIDAALRSLSNE